MTNLHLSFVNGLYLFPFQVSVLEADVEVDGLVQNDAEDDKTDAENDVGGEGVVSDEELSKGWDSTFENETWEVFDAEMISGKFIFRMVAFDLDDGDNSQLTYSLKSGRGGRKKFQLDPNDGSVYATSSLKAGETFDLLVKASDRSQKALSTLARVSLSVLPLPDHEEGVENRPPSVAEKVSRVSVLESDPVGHLVAVIAADDKVLKASNMF